VPCESLCKRIKGTLCGGLLGLFLFLRFTRAGVRPGLKKSNSGFKLHNFSVFEKKIQYALQVFLLLIKGTLFGGLFRSLFISEVYLGGSQTRVAEIKFPL